MPKVIQCASSVPRGLRAVLAAIGALVLSAPPGDAAAQLSCDTTDTIACGQTRSGSIGSPGEQDCYTFSVNGGERINIDLSLTSAAGETWTLYDPNGIPVGAACTIGYCSPTLPLNAGTYTVQVSDTGSDETFSYGLTLQGLSANFTCGSPLVCGGTGSGSMIAGDTDTFTFAGNANERVNIAVSQGTAAEELWQLYDPDGLSVGASTYATATLPKSGTYTIIVVDGSSDEPFSYNLTWQGLSAGLTCGPPLGCGVTGSGSPIVGDTDTFTFAGNANERVNIAVSQGTGAEELWQLYDPDGLNVVDFSTYANATLPKSGTYTIIVVDGDVDEPFSYNLTWQGLSDGLTCGPPLACGVTGSGSPIVGDTDTFTFAGNANEWVNIAVSQGTAAEELWQLYDPDGLSVGLSTYANVTLPKSGTYTIIVVDGSVDEPFSYNLTWQGLSDSLTCGPPLACGVAGSGSPIVGDTDTFTFGGFASDLVQISLSQGSPAEEQWQLFDPDGVLVQNFCFGTCAPSLPAKSGTYTIIVVDGDVDEPIPAYTLTLTGAGPTCLAQTVPDGIRVAVEYSTDLDLQVSAGGTSLDPAQVLYTEPPDGAADPNPRNGLDFFPGLESGNEPDAQVDALANRNDALFDDVLANAADLLVSLEPDPAVPTDTKAYLERLDGSTAAVWSTADLDSSAGVVVEVDALELWGLVGADDATYYSLSGDVTTTSIFYQAAGVSQPYLSRAQVFAAIGALFTGTQQQVDVDALMLNDLPPVGTWSAGDAVLVSLRAAANLDGGEVFVIPFTGTTAFLAHGGHVWNTAFDVSLAFTGLLGSEEIDALEAAPPGSAALCGGAPGDEDGDLVCDGQDNCPGLPNPGQANFDGDMNGDACDACETIADAASDLDGDGVHDACDTCTTLPNPPLGGSPAPNRSFISHQRDDDADGRGNRCDFDYNNVGIVLTSSDFNDMKFSLLPSPGLMTASSCGATVGAPPGEGGSGANQRCGEFDHDGSGAVVTAADFNLSKAAVAAGGVINPNFPKCSQCTQGTGWSNVLGPGARVGRPICQSAVAGACVYAP